MYRVGGCPGLIRRIVILETAHILLNFGRAIPKQKTLEVKITSAYELSNNESDALITALSSKLGRDIGLEISVDEKLIGGAIIKTEDNVIDDSIKGKLEKFANNLN